MSSHRKKRNLEKTFCETSFETGFESGIDTRFETGFETARVVLVVERLNK